MTQDAGFDVDFTGISADELVPMPEGVYDVTVFDAKVAIAKTGSKYVAWEFKVSEGDHMGRRAWLNNSLQQQALWALKRSLIAMGEDPIALEGRFKLNLKAFLGRPCKIVIAHEQYEGTPRQRVTRVLPRDASSSWSGPEIPEVEPEDLPFE